MDGYALRCRRRAGRRHRAAASASASPAGQVGTPLQPGTAARIFTGAQIPAGADAVVMQEQCERAGRADGGAHRCSVPRAGPVDPPPRRGRAARRGGAAQRAAPDAAGAGPGGLGRRRRSCGCARRPRVALFSTGDELAMPGEPLKPGAIYNSNRFTLRGLLQAAGLRVRRPRHRARPARRHARGAAPRRRAGNDLIVTCGGVSVGEEDHLKPAVRAEGRLDMWQIAIKPGKPLAFGEVLPRRRLASRCSSACRQSGVELVTFLLAVRPVLLRLQGATARWRRSRCAMRADFDWPRADTRAASSCACARNADGRARTVRQPGLGVLTSTVWADGLVDNPGGTTPSRRGDTRAVPAVGGCCWR